MLSIIKHIWHYRRRRDAAILKAIGDGELFGGDIKSDSGLGSMSDYRLAMVLNSMVRRGLLTCRDRPLEVLGRTFHGIRAWSRV